MSAHANILKELPMPGLQSLGGRPLMWGTGKHWRVNRFQEESTSQEQFLGCLQRAEGTEVAAIKPEK